jgi:hypothetical protein
MRLCSQVLFERKGKNAALGCRTNSRNSRIVMFITVAIDLLVQPKNQSRSPKEWRTKKPKIILKVPSNIMPLPPRAPELNGQENIWQFMRQNWLSKAQAVLNPSTPQGQPTSVLYPCGT